jgi:hypothetical protein
VDGVEPVRLQEEQRAEMRHVAGAGRAIGKLAGVGSYVGDELVDVVRRDRGVHRQHERDDSGQGDGREVAHDIVAQLCVE